MAYEDLLKSVEESASEQERELRRKAAETAAAVRERGKKRAESIQQAHADEARRSVIAERNKALYLVRAKNKEQLIRTREAACEKAFSKALARLSTLRSSPEYPAIFRNLLQEAAGAFGDEAFLIHIDSRDEALCRTTMDHLKIKGEVRADVQTAGGVVLALPDNSVVVSNTVESRLEQIREHQRHVIHAILSGD